MSLHPDARFDPAAQQAWERSDETEAAGRLPVDLVAQMAQAGAFKLTVPTCYGGSQAPMQYVLDTIERFAYHDGSAGWAVMIANTTATLSAWMDPHWAQVVFGPDGAIAGGHAQPNGLGRLVDGGLRVTGKWEWGSGSSHVTSMGGGVRVVDANGEPAAHASGARAMLAFFDPDDVELLDTWHVAGMKGTASTDYRVTEAFVPDGRWADVGPLSGGRPTVDSALYRFPFYGNFAVSVSYVLLGLAHRAVDELEQLGDKRPAGSRSDLAHRSSARAALATADAAVRSARAFAEDAVGSAWSSAQDGIADVEQRRLLRLAACNTAERALFAVNTCFGAAGGSAVYNRCPLSRIQRDVLVGAQHAMVAPAQLDRIGG
ncbi:MAG: acyl-CoA dehydrogenase family protein, partial [Acidimicrobiales bacterium]|nr:acyl-CoA dehydrogenase family protein [Acidimicrobiales bacterium]